MIKFANQNLGFWCALTGTRLQLTTHACYRNFLQLGRPWLVNYQSLGL